MLSHTFSLCIPNCYFYFVLLLLGSIAMRVIANQTNAVMKREDMKLS